MSIHTEILKSIQLKNFPLHVRSKHKWVMVLKRKDIDDPIRRFYALQVNERYTLVHISKPVK